MKILPTLLSLGFILSFTSCTTYYYSQLHSNNIEVEKANDGQLVIETDTLSIAYCFYGENAPITISIFNKISRPLFIDWSKSAIVINNIATPYKDPDIPGFYFDEFRQGGSFYDWKIKNDSTDSDVIADNAQFIAPKAKISYTPLELADFSFEKYFKKEYSKKKISSKDGEKEIKTINYTEENSPLIFSSYLTIYDPTNPSEPMFFEQEFYISELIKAGNIAPEQFSKRLENNTFYVKKEKGKKFLKTVATVCIAILGTSIEIIN